jgi:Arm DNA-binding domain
MDYHWAGKRGTLAFGVYPAVSLAEAREKRNVAKKQFASGIDPGAQKKLDKIAAATSRQNTFRLVADEGLEKLSREGKAAATLSK